MDININKTIKVPVGINLPSSEIKGANGMNGNNINITYTYYENKGNTTQSNKKQKI
jgi:hypothetical protein